MKIAYKIFIAPIAAMIFLVGSGVASLIVMGQQAQRLIELGAVTGAGFKSGSAQLIAVGRIHSQVYALIGTMASLDEKAIKASNTKIDRQIDEVAADLTKMQQTPILKATALKVLPILAEYKKAVVAAIDLASMDPNTGVAAMQTASEKYKALNYELSGTTKAIETKTAELIVQNEAEITKIRWIISVLILVAVFALGLTAVLVARSVTRPLKLAVRIAQTVAAGDLTSRIESSSQDETGQLLLALKGMNDHLGQIVGNVRNSANAISTASTQIATGTLDLSSRTEQQAGSLEETASSMEELISTVKQNADNSQQANQLAVSASAVALKGGAVVAQVVDTMDSINASSKKIADIIGVIDGIAFQTNILALNAAVEAARAGEQGRGFAVVASEVRNLAQRSAAAAKEIKTLIGDSVEKVDIGTKLVNQAGATMHEIVASVKRVTDIMTEITSASQEQILGIGQVNQSIVQMDEATQQNAALVEETAAAAQSMREQAGNLVQVVDGFKINA